MKNLTFFHITLNNLEFFIVKFQRHHFLLFRSLKNPQQNCSHFMNILLKFSRTYPTTIHLYEIYKYLSSIPCFGIESKILWLKYLFSPIFGAMYDKFEPSYFPYIFPLYSPHIPLSSFLSSFLPSFPLSS